MRFAFTPELEHFRQEVREFFRQALPPNWEGGSGFEATPEEFNFGLEFERKLAQRGWLTMHWPQQYGGQGRSILEQAVFNEEKGYARVPSVTGTGLYLVGPTLITHGTPEQKAQHLPPIARAQVVWCQGFSEPGSGSDLASLQTRAIRDGDDYVVNGQKLWTTNAHFAQWCILLARTDPDVPKHKGISFFLVDMRSPGITVRPVWIFGGGRVNEVYFDNVRVPRANLVGEENKGWYVAMTTLSFERSGIGGVARARRMLEELVAVAKSSGNGSGFRKAVLRHKLAEIAVEISVARMLAYRVAWLQQQGRVPDLESSMSKLFISEMTQRLTRVGMELLGLYGQLEPGSKHAALKGRTENAYIYALPATVYAGTSEIQRNIISQRGLGLPR